MHCRSILFAAFLASCVPAQASEPIWSSTVPGPEAQIIQTGAAFDNGDVLVVGFDTQEGAGSALAVRLDAQGNLLWQRTYSVSPLAERATDVIALAHGEAIIVASANLPNTGGDYRPWLIRIDDHGEVIWSSEQGLTQEVLVDSAIVQGVRLPGGDLVIAGGANGFSDVQDPWLARVDLHGNVQDFRSFEPLGGRDYGVATYVMDLIVANDGDLVLTGAATSFPGSAYLWKLDPHFNERWHQIYQGANLNGANNLVQIDAGFAVVGPTFNSDALALMKTDEHGGILSLNEYPAALNYASGEGLSLAPDGSGYLLRNAFSAFGSINLETQLLEVGEDGALISESQIAEGQVATALVDLIPAQSPAGFVAAGYLRDSNNRSESDGIAVRFEADLGQMLFAADFEAP